MFFLVFIFSCLAVFKLLLYQLGLPFDLRILLSPSVEFLHETCVQQTAHFANHSEAAAALVCGHQIESLTLQSTFAASGLIHLLVVSGSHLLLLDRGLNYFLKNQTSIRLCLLFLFVMICEMNAPIMRSFIAILVATVIKSEKWVWSASFKQWTTTLLCVLINPVWIFSLSFQMSWLASLSLDLAAGLFSESKFKQNLLRILLIYFAFFFVFLFLGFPSLWSPLFGLALAPVLELILFPLALIACLIPQLTIVFESIFSTLIQIIEVFDPEKHFILYIDRESVLFYNSIMIVLFLAAQIKLTKVNT